MIIVLKQHAPDEKVKAFCNELQTMGYQINDSMGSDTHILGLIGDTKALSESWVLANPVVETCRRSLTKRQTASSTRTIPWWKWVIRKSRLAAAILP
mgnify:CR=1 FL=1